MKLLVLLVCAAWVCQVMARVTTTADPRTQLPVEDRLKELEGILDGLSKQVMLQQFYLEEKIRSDGNSGIKQVRVQHDGTKNYYSAAHLGNRFLAIHDHANYDRTAGMGELNVVMNGVEFRTRHNDYKLRMPCRNCTDYNKIEDIPFPDVPPSVQAKATIDEQIKELREYFKAFKTQNVTHRDYRPYFKANLCYIEGAWTTGIKDVDEPFQSDRHSIDASNWMDLMQKIRYSSITGLKSVLENYAFLPTNIMSVEKGHPNYVQWNYRIVCHPLVDDLPLKVFKKDDDLLYRMPHRTPFDKMDDTRSARYHINERAADFTSSGRSLLDNIMMTVPGKDNYPSKMYDHSFDMVMEDVRYSNHTLINTGYYHRYFKTLDKGAMGTKSIHSGFNDANLWVAQTSHPQVAPINVTACHREGQGRNKHQVCKSWTNRVSYAIPLEVIYLTPLQKWNPYDLAMNVEQADVTAHGKRLGHPDLDSAFNGTTWKKFHYLTPSAFYQSAAKTGPRDPADTAKSGAGVLDKAGNLRIVDSSGIRIMTPDIEGVGKVRLRYPIMPVHGEGSGVWKELNALKEMTMHMNRYASLYEERPGSLSENGTTDEATLLHFKVQLTVQDPPGEHSHDIYINEEELDEIKHNRPFTVTTSEDMGHTHELTLRWDNRRHRLIIRRCDGLAHCWDGHSNYLVQQT